MPPRPRHKMPEFIRDALNERRLMDAYHPRAPYQQNDYIGTLCVNRAKPKATKQKRLDQMLAELTGDKLYMGMKWNP